MSNCKNSNVARITATLAAGSAASPYYVMANITKRLCRPVCASNTPVFAPAFSLVGFSQVGTGQYVAVVRVQGCICYNPCGTDGCCSRTETVSQTFTIPFASATAPTSVTVAAGNTVNAVSVTGCQSCGRTFVSETPLTLTVA
jgi:hypothetical protein|nr:MAG TPA: hypothetical protein [Caudoviricetes sp.]